MFHILKCLHTKILKIL